MSSKGQISIPLAERKKTKHKLFRLTRKGSSFLLEPVEYRVITNEDTQENEHILGEYAFSQLDTWNVKKDDEYAKFYLDNPNKQ